MVFVQEKDNKASAKKLTMSSFKQSDLCVYQLLYITHEKYQLFNDSFELTRHLSRYAQNF